VTRPLRWIVLAAALLLAPGLAGAPERLGGRVELHLLREAACHWETRGEAEPGEAIGPGQEIGRCQIKPGSARAALAEPPLVELLVRLVVRPEPIADAILRDCEARGKARAFDLADCYHRGPSARGAPTGRDREYAKQLAADYAAAWLGRHP